ncbi:hypothetical protein DYBT9623_05266 [Dyadobacter sp. CECT 9623]|uniref:Uncharacterized protein n=1 Tax=Dyadobacter linearis TaxID=2823330 RepID=A0ABM8UY87_9BACT|nr:hypothetical protein DYBT9623_05266 [Dyadobacter sp. CECT 9623]
MGFVWKIILSIKRNNPIASAIFNLHSTITQYLRSHHTLPHFGILLLNSARKLFGDIIMNPHCPDLLLIHLPKGLHCRPPALTKNFLLQKQGLSMNKISKQLGIVYATLYNYAGKLKT